MPDLILDFGEYGEIAVEPAFQEKGFVQAGLGDTVRGSVEKVLKAPLTGFSKALLATLPEETENDAYQLNEFSVEFELGLGGEIGQEGGVPGIVAKIMTSGTFKCTYTWQRKK